MVMTRIIPRLAILLTMMASVLACTKTSPPKQPEAQPMRLVQALFLDGGVGHEPSGLTMFNDTLYTISNNDDDTIFRVIVTGDRALLQPYLRFAVPPPEENVKRIDFEGITCDPEGNFYLASESTCRILKVSPGGKEVKWITPSLRPYGRAKGMLEKKNASLEGIAWAGTGRFVACAERQARGFLEIDLKGEAMRVKATVHDTEALPIPKPRNPDYAGLCYYQGKLYALERAAGAVSQIDLTGQGVVEKSFWLYREIEDRPDLRYQHRKYGHGEGLFINDRYVYLIFDNNRDAREAAPDDIRPLFLILERPNP